MVHGPARAARRRDRRLGRRDPARLRLVRRADDVRRALSGLLRGERGHLHVPARDRGEDPRAVRATIAARPRRSCTSSRCGEVGVLVAYTSERRLCAMLEGLVLGTAEHYGETLVVEEIQCMHRGDAGCVFTVTRTLVSARMLASRGLESEAPPSGALATARDPLPRIRPAQRVKARSRAPSSKGFPGGRSRRRLRPGETAAPERESLALLPSGPDAVRMLPVRGTRPSTPRARDLIPLKPSLGRRSVPLERMSGSGNR